MVAIIFTFNFLPFSVLLSLLWIDSGKMKIVHMLYNNVSVSRSRRETFRTLFLFAVYENP